MANDEYLTPAKYIPSIRNVLGSDFTDLFSSSIANERIKATRFYSKAENAFHHQWNGNCFANPPYSRGNLPQYSHFLLRHFNHLSIPESLSLLPNSTSEIWFQNLIKHKLALLCLTDHKIKFTTFEYGNFKENSSPDFGNAFIYLGRNPNRFISEFRKWGTILKAIDLIPKG